MTNATREALLKTYETLRRAGWDQPETQSIPPEDADHRASPQQPGEVARSFAYNYVVESLKELCEEEGPGIRTKTIVEWIDRLGGFNSEAELIAYAKEIKARQYARQFTYEDEETGLRIRRFWSFRDPATRERCHNDILQLPEERRRRLVQEYAQFLEQLKSVRRAMADYLAGQEFFPFYVEEEQENVRASLGRAIVLQELVSDDQQMVPIDSAHP